ncbi:hypothetical protein [Capnocytophaga cynodegmi]|uniref:hypothetical protein n=1 Tax=Capnocytophaga cynodegmi TaxID=28189 RepID=UPI000DD07C50|nr:hypothetical protein [Capnocytophaga cynodegmi]
MKAKKNRFNQFNSFVSWKKWIAPTRIALVNFPSSNTDNDSQKRGKRIGTAYQLENGDIVYLSE